MLVYRKKLSTSIIFKIVVEIWVILINRECVIARFFASAHNSARKIFCRCAYAVVRACAIERIIF